MTSRVMKIDNALHVFTYFALVPSCCNVAINDDDNNNNVKFLYSALHMQNTEYTSQNALTIITAAYRIREAATKLN